MKVNARSAHSLFTAVLCGLVLLAGCSDETETTENLQEVQVQVTDEKAGQPVAGIKIVLMDPTTNHPEAGPLVTDARGRCDFGVLPQKPRRLLAFCGGEYFILSLPDFPAQAGGALPNAGTGIPAGLIVSPHTKTLPLPILGLEVLVRKVVPDTVGRIAGRIIDAESGLPLDRVFVSLSPLLSGYQGLTFSSDDITLGDGNFSVSPILFGPDPDTGNLNQIQPLHITRNGYRPLIWSFDPPNGSINMDIKGVTITMTPVDEGDRGAISGRIMRAGLPAAGIVVGVGVVDSPKAEKAGAGMPGWAAVTDQDGRFTIEKLPTGSYTVQPGFPLADGALFPNPLGHVPLKVEADRTSAAGDLIVMHEISPQWPVRGMTLISPPTTLQWTKVPGAVSYQVSFDRKFLAATDTNGIDLPELLVISPGLHGWSVGAFNEKDELLGFMQVSPLFRLLPSPE